MDAYQRTGEFAVGAHHCQHPFPMGRRVVHVFGNADKSDVRFPKTPESLNLHRAFAGPPVYGVDYYDVEDSVVGVLQQLGELGCCPACLVLRIET